MLTAAFEARRVRTSEMTTGEERLFNFHPVVFILFNYSRQCAKESKHLAEAAESCRKYAAIAISFPCLIIIVIIINHRVITVDRKSLLR